MSSVLVVDLVAISSQSRALKLKSACDSAPCKQLGSRLVLDSEDSAVFVGVCLVTSGTLESGAVSAKKK